MHSHCLLKSNVKSSENVIVRQFELLRPWQMDILTSPILACKPCVAIVWHHRKRKIVVLTCPCWFPAKVSSTIEDDSLGAGASIMQTPLKMRVWTLVLPCKDESSDTGTDMSFHCRWSVLEWWCCHTSWHPFRHSPPLTALLLATTSWGFSWRWQLGC